VGKFTKRIFVITILILLSSGFAFSQAVHYGKIAGKVIDSEGKALPGVTVTVLSDALIKGKLSTITNDEGKYYFSSLPIGVYTVKANLEGFETKVQKGVEILAGKSYVINFTLKMGKISEVIEVTAKAPILDVRTATTDQTVDSDMLKSLPTTRDAFYDLATSTPGMFDVGSESSWLPSPTAYGGATNENVFLVNGVNTTNPRGGSWGSLVNVNYSAVKEVRIIALGSKAEYGNFSGVAIDVVTKSGSNSFHGNLGIFSNVGSIKSNQPAPDEDLGKDWIYINKGDNVFNEPTKDLEYSFTLGGPIIKNALWFYSGFDYIDSRHKVPFFTPEKGYKGRYYDIKLTGQAGYNIRSWLSYHFENNDNTNESWGTLGWDPEVVYNPNFKTHSVSAEFQWNITGTTTFTTKYLGFWNVEKSYLPDNAPNHPAYINWWKWVAKDMGINGAFPWVESYRNNRQTVQADVASYTDKFLGEHDIKFGVQYTKARGNAFNGYFHGYGLNAYPYAWDQSADYMQDYFGGFPMYVNKVTQNPYLTVRSADSLGVFFDDMWTIGDRLTINIGVRYDKMTSKFEEGKVYQQASEPNKVYDAPVLRTREGSDNIFDFKTFSPRIGFAYMITKDAKTVLRASYGRYYTPISVENLGEGGPDMDDVTTEYMYYTLPMEQVDLNGDGYIDSDEVIAATRLLRGATPDWTDEYVSNPSYLLNVSKDLKNQYTDQFTVTLERELFTDFKFSVSYIYKKTKNMIVRWPIDKHTGKEWNTITVPYVTEDGVHMNLLVVPFSDFNGDGEINGDDVAYFFNAGNYEWRNLPTFNGVDPHRTYQGLQFVLRKRYSNRWQMMMSFLYSSSDGVAGRNKRQDQDLNMEGPNFLNDAWIRDYNQLVNNMTGPLPFVPKYEFKFNASYTIPKIEVDVGIRFRYNSGRPVWRITDVDLDQLSDYTVLHSWDMWNDEFADNSIMFCADDVQILSMDSENPEYLPPNKIFDLHISKSFKLGPGSLDMGVDILNIFNDGNITNVLVKGDSFGRVTGITYPPRMIRFNLSYEF